MLGGLGGLEGLGLEGMTLESGGVGNKGWEEHVDRYDGGVFRRNVWIEGMNRGKRDSDRVLATLC